MRQRMFFILLVLTQVVFAQTFTEIPQFTAFPGVSGGSIAFADVDGDNDQDVLIMGSSSPGGLISKLYTNDGRGIFTERLGTPFAGVIFSSIAFADVDGDNDQDVLITGAAGGSVGRISKLYTNDGMGTFTEVMGTPFVGVAFSSIAFADVDGDNDQDVLITGSGSSGGRISKLYTNDGMGTFTEVMGTPFEGVDFSSIAFADVDGDNDQDVLITGFGSSGGQISKLYTNDGMGTFVEMMGTPFVGVDRSSIAFADVDGDNDQDVLIMGYGSTGGLISKLYTNDGVGIFSEMMGTPFEGVALSLIAFADVDGDNDQDVLIMGVGNSGGWIPKLYTNDGVGTFTEVMDTPFEGVIVESSMAFADIDGDNDPDVLITGKNSSLTRISKLYINDGMGTFAEMMGTPFVGVIEGSIAFADVDGDNDQDVVITGQNSSENRISKLYTNDGMGTFTEMISSYFPGVDGSSIAFADVDGDNDQEVLITGQSSSEGLISKLYTQNWMGAFTEMMGTPFEGVVLGSIAFADVDGDNDPDVLITGFGSSVGPISKLYTNNGMGTFAEMMGTPFVGVVESSIAFADVDGDNDQDVLITGFVSVGVPISKLYTNNGLGTFTEMMGTPFEGLALSSIAFADVDGDNDQDVLITGLGSVGVPISKLYTNNGMGTFTEMMGTPFEGVVFGSIAFADVDGDNDPDVLITGFGSVGVPISKLYTNNGMGTFTEMMGTPFEGVARSSIAFADVDGDNDQDVLITGENSSGVPISKLYTNDGAVSSTEDLPTGFRLDFKLFPNPSSSSTFFLRCDLAEMTEVTISVYNVNGVLLSQQKEFSVIGQQTFSIDIASLPKGNYFLELDNGKRKGVAKFIVQ